jgi:serine/threonine-protein kinase RsbW
MAARWKDLEMKQQATEDDVPQVAVAAKLENLRIIGDFIAGTMHQLGKGTDSEVYQVQLAVDEACTNIIEHAYAGDTDEPIKVNCSISGDELTVQIRDWGEPFDPTAVPLPDLDGDASQRQKGGLGVFLMRKAMDEVHYVFHAMKFNELTMIKRLNPSSSAATVE